MTNQNNNKNTAEEKFKDKRLYSIGDASRNGSEISGIYGSSVDYILFWGETAGLCWEIDEATSDVNEVLCEARRICTLASSSLTKQRSTVVYSMLADIIITTLHSVDFNYNEKLFSDILAYISKYKDEIKSVVSSGPMFTIYRVKDDFIQWHHSKLPENLRKSVEEFSTLQSLATSVLPVTHRKSVSRLLSSSLSSAFRTVKLSDDIDYFEQPRKFIYSQIESFLKVKIFYVSLITTFIMQFILLCGYGYFGTGLEYFASASAGIFGVMVSSLQRNNKTQLDPYSSPQGLYSESISRIFIGVIFGLFIIFCAKSELALAPFKDDIYALVCFAFISGFSERFVPDLMSTVAGKANGEG